MPEASADTPPCPPPSQPENGEGTQGAVGASPARRSSTRDFASVGETAVAMVERLKRKHTEWVAYQASIGKPIEPYVPSPPRPKAPPPPAVPQPPSDELELADAAWLTEHAEVITAIGGLALGSIVGRGFTRQHWRLAVASLVGRSPGEVGNKAAYVAGLLRRARGGACADARAARRYAPARGWPACLYAFVSVSMPS